MSYSFERLIPDEDNAGQVTVQFRKKPEGEYGWIIGRFEMPAGDLAKAASMSADDVALAYPVFSKLIAGPAPEEVQNALAALVQAFGDTYAVQPRAEESAHGIGHNSGNVVPFQPKAQVA